MWTSPSPEAAKRIEDAAIRRRLWWPTLARTPTSLVILRPVKGGGRSMAEFMAQKLPEFGFDSQHNRWSAPLTEENYRAAVVANSVKLSRDCAEVQLKTSSGVMAWLREREEEEETSCAE